MSTAKRHEDAGGGGLRRPERPGKRRFVYTTGRRSTVRRILCALCCALFLFGCVHLIMYFMSARRTRVVNEELQALYVGGTQSLVIETPSHTPTWTPAPETTPAPKAAPPITPRPIYHTFQSSHLPNMQALLDKNDDLVGWVRIPGVVNLPVVYRDNTYYLTRDFYGKKSDSGTLFLDEHHPLTARTQYLVIHGHNMQDGSMFGLLRHYLRVDYIRKHGIVYFSTLDQQEEYAAFAVLRVPMDVNAAGYVAYTGTPMFKNEAQFNAFVAQLTRHSLYRIPVDVAPSDALLTLSTCLNDDRLILVCRRLRDGETEKQMRAVLQSSMDR